MAESLYWIGRYVERAEQTARLTDGNVRPHARHGLDARRPRRAATATGRPCSTSSASSRPSHPAASPPDEESVPAHLIFSTENANSIVECIARARDNARTMRHQVATEMWEALNRFHLDVQRPGQRRRAAVRRRERRRASAARSSTSASCSRESPTRRCRARRAGTSSRRASSWSGPSGRRARSTSTTGSSSATTPTTATASRLRPRPTTCSRGARCCARCRPTSRTTASRAGASSRAR